MPMQHAAYFTGDQWKILQDLSGQTNPASYVREVVERHIRQKIADQASKERHPSNQAPDMKMNELLEGRWKAIGCAKRVFDPAFNRSRDWYVAQFTSEEAALAELEERHARESLNNPRAWLHRQWLDAGRP